MERTCLKCNQSFNSTHVGNRICGKCTNALHNHHNYDPPGGNVKIHHGRIIRKLLETLEEDTRRY